MRTQEVEGKFFVWTSEEIRAALAEPVSHFPSVAHNIDRRPVFPIIDLCPPQF